MSLILASAMATVGATQPDMMTMAATITDARRELGLFLIPSAFHLVSRSVQEQPIGETVQQAGALLLRKGALPLKDDLCVGDLRRQNGIGWGDVHRSDHTADGHILAFIVRPNR